jgi:hypothetical protein
VSALCFVKEFGIGVPHMLDEFGVECMLQQVWCCHEFIRQVQQIKRGKFQIVFLCLGA